MDHASAAMTIPADLDRDGVEHYRLRVETMLNRLTLEAEAWADAGTPKIGEAVPPRLPAFARRLNAEARDNQIQRKAS